MPRTTLRGKARLETLQKALKLYTNAADAGDASSAISLGLLLAEGKAVPLNVKKAAEYLQGDRENHGCVGHHTLRCRLGTGRRMMTLPAYLRLDKRKFGQAARILGEHFQEGSGIRNDLFEARHWYSRAASAGDEVARARLEKMPKAGLPKIEMPKVMTTGIGMGMAAGSMGPNPKAGSAASPPEQSEEILTVEERYPNIEAPDTVHPSVEFSVQVSLTGEQIDAQTRILSGNQSAGASWRFPFRRG